MNKNFRIEFEDNDLLPTRGDEGEDVRGDGGGGAKGGGAEGGGGADAKGSEATEKIFSSASVYLYWLLVKNP